MRRRRRSQRIIGLFPRVGQGLTALGRWTIHHPQPFLTAVLLLGMGWGSWWYAQHTEAFQIQHIALPPQPAFQLRPSLIGANVWSVDLQALAEELAQQQPWLKDVRVVRELPDTIRIEAIPRVPVAQVRLEGTAARGATKGSWWHAVDQDGFLLPEGQAAPLERLVRFVGIQRPGAVLRAGAEHRDERLALALRVLETLRRASPLIARRVTEIN
ncbi:MAG: FtsQ-type POTRA domain-containing protein, partial [Candidatus Omnitrophica bacterium]|nr:FtsQ-type POTRA domain-containing protein [Candidatus Omnitrophota bacterium]